MQGRCQSQCLYLLTALTEIFGETMYAKKVMKILETNSEALADRKINSSKMLSCRQRVTVNIPLEDLVFDRLHNFIHFVF